LGNAEHQINVLTEKTGDTVEFFQDGDTGNSIFREDSQHYATSKSVQRKTITLDDAVQASFLKGNKHRIGGGDKKEEAKNTSISTDSVVDFIKIDVQGAELIVLEGGPKTLAEASFVQLESGATEYNPGGSCFYEVDEFLRSHGFYLYDITDVDRNPAAFKTHGMGQWDSLYVRPLSDRLPEKFKELKGTYCGMGRSISTGNGNMQNDRVGTDGDDVGTTRNLITIGIIFSLGFVAGRLDFVTRHLGFFGAKSARTRV